MNWLDFETPEDDKIIEDDGHLKDYGYLESLDDDDDLEFYNATGIQI